jgi:hypothetical protein
MTSDKVLYNDSVASICHLAANYLNYTSDCSLYEGFGYVIQYNFTALHAALMFENRVNEALSRRGSGNPFINVKTTIAPLPVTPIEANIGAAEDAFAAWFLVSTDDYIF